ncbi:hypothetical protein MMC31_008179, partial [Peltigera leucophlebia]|nr:hypothetical protein [Peltigera leucophlebia]
MTENKNAEFVDTAPLSMRIMKPKVILIQWMEFQARPLMEDFRKKKLISPVDPLEIEDNTLVSTLWTPRPRIVKEIFQRALEFRIVLIRGTPASGKTILMNLIRKHVLEVRPGWVVHTIDGWPQGMTSKASEMFLRNEYKLNLQFAKNSVVFIDDAQSSYYDDSLWNSFKILDFDSAIVILFSSYGSPGGSQDVVHAGTPPIFLPEQTISLHKELGRGTRESIGILLEKDEMEDLFKRFRQHHPNHPHLIEDLRTYIQSITGGHAGAIGGLLETVVSDPASIPFLSAEDFIFLMMILAKCARNGSKFDISLADFNEVFQAEPTLKHLRESLVGRRFMRGVPEQKDIQSDLSIADFLKEMAKRGLIQVKSTGSQEFEAGARTAYLRGWVHRILDNNTEFYIFASPIHRWHCQGFFQDFPHNSINAASPLELAIDIIKNMKPRKFALPAKNPNPFSTSLPPEDWYSKEFYRASEKVLDGGVVWSPEYGTKGVMGGGAIDFYLGSEKWGVEFTRDGDRLKDH